MGIVNPRAICPNCGAKIHTQKRKPFTRGSVQNVLRYSNKVTGQECPFCPVSLTGNVRAMTNRAELVEEGSEESPVSPPPA